MRMQIDELLVAGTVNTEFESQDLTIAGEMIDDSAIITISSPVTSATVIKDNIIACKVRPAFGIPVTLHHVNSALTH